MAPAVLGVVLTATFVLLGLWDLGRLVTAPDRAARFSNGLLVLAAVAVAALPWVRPVPSAVEVVAFTLGSLWFVFLALFEPSAGSASGVPARGLDGRIALWYQAGGMAALVWLAVVLAPHGPAAGDTQALPGSGIGALATATAADRPWWMAAGTVVIGVVFAVAAGWFALQLVREPPAADAEPRGTRDLNASAIRAGGMAFACIAIVARSV